VEQEPTLFVLAYKIFKCSLYIFLKLCLKEIDRCLGGVLLVDNFNYIAFGIILRE
jgi:hypothetical protein